MESTVFNHMGWDLQAARRTAIPHSPPWLYATTEALKDCATETSCQGCRVGGFWVESKLDSFSNTRIRISLSESDIPNGSFFWITLLSCVGNSCWNGTIHYETFVETENGCIPRFPFRVWCYKILDSQTLFTLCWGVGNLKSLELKLESDILPPTPQPLLFKWFPHKWFQPSRVRAE